MTAALPCLTDARCELTRTVDIVDAAGARRTLEIPAERALTLYVDKRELVTLMTLGQAPELLVLGYLLNQGLIGDVHEVASVSVDWEVEAAAVLTHDGIERIELRSGRRSWAVSPDVMEDAGIGALVDDFRRRLTVNGPMQLVLHRGEKSLGGLCSHIVINRRGIKISDFLIELALRKANLTDTLQLFLKVLICQDRAALL